MVDHDIFRPRVVVLVGATEKAIWTRSIVNSFADFGFAGKVFAVNREGRDVFGLTGFSSCVAVPETIDVAYILVPVSAVRDAIRDAIAAKIKMAVVLTSGFSETGPAGAALQDGLVKLARDGGLTLFGPNSLGFVNLAERCPVSSLQAPLPLLEGSVAIVSQSGSVASELMNVAHRHRVGLSFVAATGNEAMVTVADMIDFLVAHPPTRVIAIYVETIKAADAIKAAATRALDAGKPVVILKIGSSELTALIAAAHTGALVGDDQVFDAACAYLGMLRVRTLEDLVMLAGLLAKQGSPSKPGVGVVSISGGACGMIADLGAPLGIDYPAFSTQTVERLKAVLPTFASTLNPLDITGAAMVNADLFEKAVEIIGADPSIGSVYVVYPVPEDETDLRFNPFPAIGKGLAQVGGPGGVWTQSVQPITAYADNLLISSGISFCLNGLEHGSRAIAAAAHWGKMYRNRHTKPEFTRDCATRITGVRIEGERALLDYLASNGVKTVPGVIAQNRAAAADLADKFAAAVVLKIASKDIAHKTDAGGVRLNVRGGEEAARAYDEIRASVAAAHPDARIDGVVVSPMRRGGLEMFVGIARDPAWGLVLAVGLGGVWIELIQDTALALLPTSSQEVKNLLTRLRGARIFEGCRGSEKVNIDDLAETIVRIGDAAMVFGDDMLAFEVNPLLVGHDGIEALDALVVWADHGLAKPIGQPLATSFH